MKIIGLDVGSRAIKLVVLQKGKCVFQKEMATGFDYVQDVQALLHVIQPHKTLVTGYGRHLLSKQMGFEHVTEIKAHAKGIHSIFSRACTILDIGGQDIKAISLTSDGRVRDFIMNDRCAAGTGRFLEAMATSLNCSIVELNEMALQGSNDFSINSTCTVFAETEVISLKAQGANPADVARAVIKSIAQRAASLLNRLSITQPLCFCGGVARNKALVKELEAILGIPVLVPEHPEFTGALGAALLAS